MPRNPNRSAPVRHGTRGLLLDLQALLAGSLRAVSSDSALNRRRALQWLGASAGAAVAVAACGSGGADASVNDAGAGTTGGATGGSATGTSASAGTSAGSSSSTTSVGACSEIPSETEGPYPADGTQARMGNGGAVNALAISGIVRSDVRTSIGGAGTTAQGVPVTLKLKLVSSANGCTPLANRAIYVWHCDRDGNYSLYSTGGVSSLDYLRGVQVTDANGDVTFTTIFPACYSGRWPHIHFEIYTTLAEALDSSRVGDYTKVSQLALPYNVCADVYNNASGYASSIRNLTGVTLTSDNVFGNDQAARQMATVTGSTNDGYVVSLTIGVAS